MVATELTGWLSYTATSVAAHTVRADRVSTEFARCAEQRQATAQRAIRRITELGGRPVLCPTELGSRSIRPFADANSVPQMLEAQLAAERKTVEYYRDAIQWMGDRDPTTRRLLEDLLAGAEHTASELDHLTA